VLNIEIQKMAVESKSFPAAGQALPPVEVRVRAASIGATWRRRFTWAQVIVGFLFVECALWAARLSVRSRWAVAASVLVILLAVMDQPSVGKLGLRWPKARESIVIFGVGAAIAASMMVGAYLAGGQIPANPTFPNWHMAWKYVLWALLQQFLLQSFFYVRFEALFGSDRAFWVSGTLFALVHLPNLILTSCTLFSGLLFCELFRRYRSIYPLGVIHALLGLTLSSVVPEALLQHMRVGIGYLQ
jgi:hypothetical protein